MATKGLISYHGTGGGWSKPSLSGYPEAIADKQLSPVPTSDSGKYCPGRRKRPCDWQAARWEPTQELVDWEKHGTQCALSLLARPLFIIARTENHCPHSACSPLLLSNHYTKPSLCGGLTHLPVPSSLPFSCWSQWTSLWEQEGPSSAFSLLSAVDYHHHDLSIHKDNLADVLCSKLFTLHDSNNLLATPMAAPKTSSLSIIASPSMLDFEHAIP